MMGRDTLANASARLQSNMVKAFTGYFRLKDFIHAVRTCKTQAEERTLVARESAAIRSSFKEDPSSDQLYHAICKLLFIHMMGYPAHFGQVESLKMAAQPIFRDKRLGYLGSTQLLDETQPTLTLITNSLKSDLNHANNAVIALALSNLAMTASPDISRDLADEVERLLRSPVAYLRKKAALCAARLIARVPDLADLFEGRLATLLGDKDHGVIGGGLGLMLQLCRTDIMLVIRFRKTLLPILVRQLQSLLSNGTGDGTSNGRNQRMGGYSMEYDVGGVNDPFLQIRLLQLLRIMGEGDAEASEFMTDTLTQVATTTDPTRNVGHAILYEAAVTIMNIESDEALRTMAINILGRLLGSSTSDHNLRYVALTLLNRITGARSIDGTNEEYLMAVQRHRATILDCLHDPDVSIRRRAVDLSLTLISSETIKAITGELLDLLPMVKGTDELAFKQSLISKLSIAMAQFAPSPSWYVDQMIRLLSHLDDAHSLGLGVADLLEDGDNSYGGVGSGGRGGVTMNEGSNDGIIRRDLIVATFVRIIGNTPSLHAYTPQQLYRTVVLGQALNGDIDNGEGEKEGEKVSPLYKSEALLQATVWVMGEFADYLVKGGGGVRGKISRVSAEGMIRIMKEWAQPTNHRSISFVGYVVNSLGKLSNRLTSVLPSSTTTSNSTTSSNLALLELVRTTLMEIAQSYVNHHDLHYRAKEMVAIIENTTLRSLLLARVTPDALGDRLGRVSQATIKLSGSRLSSAAALSPRTEKLITDESGMSSPIGTPLVKPQFTLDGRGVSENGVNDAFADLAALSLDATAIEDRKTIPTEEELSSMVFKNEELGVNAMITSKDLTEGTEGIVVDIRLGVKNYGDRRIDNVLLQCAVPKSMKLIMFPASADHIYSRDTLEQLLQVKLTDPQAKLKLRIKLGYMVEEQARQVQFDITKFYQC